MNLPERKAGKPDGCNHNQTQQQQRHPKTPNIKRCNQVNSRHGLYANSREEGGGGRVLSFE